MTIQCPECNTTYILNSKKGMDCKKYGLCKKCMDWTIRHEHELKPAFYPLKDTP